MSERLLLSEACKEIIPLETWLAWCDAIDPEQVEDEPLPGANPAERARYQYHIRQTVFALAEAGHALNRDLRSTFASGSWLAWGYPLRKTSALNEGSSLSLIRSDEWGRFDVINVPGSRVESKRSGAGYEGICCAPLLSRASACGATTLLAGISLFDAVERFILADPEVQNLYHPSRQKQEAEIFACAFTRAISAGMQLPLSDKPTIAAALLPFIAPLVTANAEAIADVLARRFDALAYYLETLHVTRGGEAEPELLGADFGRSTARLDLTDCSIVGAEQNALPVTGIRFALLPKANDLSVSDSKPKGGRPRIYDKHLASLLAEVVANPRKAGGLTSKAAIYREVEKRASSADSAAGTKGGGKAEKAFKGNPLAHSSMECIISFAQKLP